MTLTTLLKLGRVSNLPTVWTNSLTAIVLVGGAVISGATLLALIALSLAYIGGMYLNDAFDAKIDAKERPERPIPSGEISLSLVYILGFGMLSACVILLWIAGSQNATGLRPVYAGLGLCAAIIAYDAYHKSNPLSPVVMGLCRVLTYGAVGLCFVSVLPMPLLWAAGALWCYLIGLTYVAKQENLGEVKNLWPLAFLAVPLVYGFILALSEPLVWPFLAFFSAWMVLALSFLKRRGPGDIPRAVVSLIVGISLLDAMLIASTGQWLWALVALGAFVATLSLQKVIAGT